MRDEQRRASVNWYKTRGDDDRDEGVLLHLDHHVLSSLKFEGGSAGFIEIELA